uniref:Uncharacterized protein n=1 Tax=Arundo donax TaxID=35708 RepID=A0A0A9ER55_ARUDO
MEKNFDWTNCKQMDDPRGLCLANLHSEIL